MNLISVMMPLKLDRKIWRMKRKRTNERANQQQQGNEFVHAIGIGIAKHTTLKTELSKQANGLDEK